MLEDEIIISGNKAVRLLSLDDFPTTNVFGAELYDGNEDGETEKVISFDGQNILTVNKVYPLGWLNRPNSELIFTKPSGKLHDLIKEAITPGEARLEIVDRLLAKMGFPVNATAVSLEEREFILRLAETSSIPSVNERSKFFEIARSVESIYWAVSYFERWLIDLEKNGGFDALGRMHLTYVFRHIGQLDKAIKTSNVVEFGGRFKCSSQLLSVIATIRAASFLDLFEFHNDPQILFIANKTLGIAWKNHKSDEASAVYRRLDNYKRIVEEQNYKLRINSAYNDWAKWV